jgi:hypothetical protein
MLRPKKPETSFYGSYLYDRIVPQDHLLRKINAVVDFSFVNDLVKDRYTPDFGRPAEDPEFMLQPIRTSSIKLQVTLLAQIFARQGMPGTWHRGFGQ